MTGLRISKDLELPIEAATWTFGVLAIKGAGKTYGAGDSAEEIIKAGIPIVAIDPMGIWWGLRVGVDKKGQPDPAKPGLPIVVFGGQHADLPIPMIGDSRKMGKVGLDEGRLCLMVKAILESGINAVLDLAGLSKSMKTKIVAVFVSELMRLYEMNASIYGPRHVFLEEANKFCPQREVKGDVAVSTGAIESLIMSGGNYNLGATLITQRSAALNKNVLSQCNCLIVLRLLDPRDKNAVREWVTNVADPKDPKIVKWFDGLRDLKNGEAWVWHPESKIFQKIKFRLRETLHATREYFTTVQAKKIKALDVSEFVAKFNKVFAPKPKEDRIVVETKTAVTAMPKPPDLMGEIKPAYPMPVYPPPSRGQIFSVPVSDVTMRTPVSDVTVISSLEPKTLFGRVCVVLKEGTDQAGNKLWTVGGKKGIEGALETHGWPSNGVDQIVSWLLQTGILTPVQKGAVLSYRCNSRRIELVPKPVTLEAQ